MEDRFVNLGMYKAGCTKALKKIKKGQFQLCYANLALLNQDCKYVLLLVQVFAIVQMWSQLRVTRVCV